MRNRRIENRQRKRILAKNPSLLKKLAPVQPAPAAAPVAAPAPQPATPTVTAPSPAAAEMLLRQGALAGVEGLRSGLRGDAFPW